jgi:thiol:disulfide interchange protein DsbD
MIDAPLDVAIGMPMAMTLGLAYGLGPCLIACLPTLGAVFLAYEHGGWRTSWRVILPLSLGRLTAYSSLGGAAGWAGQALQGSVAAAQLNLLVGLAGILLGLALLLGRQTACRRGACEVAGTQPVRFLSRPSHALLPSGLFLAGIGMALTPCVPLGAVLFSAAARGDALGGALLGLGFGVGAILVPALAYGLGMAWLGERLRRHLGNALPVVERLAAGLLILIGLRQLANGF